MFNQKVKYDKGKYRPSLCHMELVKACARVSEYGQTKYPANTWQEVENERLYDAAMRHLIECKNEIYKCDEESGLMHLEHAVWNLGALLEKLKLEVKEDEKETEFQKQQKLTVWFDDNYNMGD